MQNRFRSLRGMFLAAVFITLLPSLARAQAISAASRITAAIDENNLTTLHGNTHPYARSANDRGEAPGSLPLARMLLVLQRGANQETALESLLEQQQDSSSPNFHHWLTPQQFGQQFGPSDQDVQTVTDWLQSHGFQVTRVSNGRTVVEFSGTANQVLASFHTSIHQYQVNGANYWANSSDPQIPAALASVVAGIDSLYNFPRKPMHHVGGQVSHSAKTGKFQSSSPSLLTFAGGQCGVPGLACYGLSPYDFATIYNVTPLWNSSPTHIDGTGVTIAVVGETDVSIQDVRNFRNIFALPASDPQVILDGPDPGVVGGDETESDLDLEWTGAVANGANIQFVISQTTETTLGVDLSAQYIVDNNLAPVLSESYGICELFLGTAGNQFYNQLWQQAAAQGITALVATGDSGSAVCDRNAGTSGPAQFGLSVSGFSSTPYNIAVGGTDFNDLTNVATYWSPTNSVPPGAPAGTPATESALSYIPETTWNNTCTNAVFGNLLGFSPSAETNCNNAQLENGGFDTPAGGSGGKSSCITGNGQSLSGCTQGYAKPAWQTALTPHDNARDLPDVSMMAAVASPSGAFYLVCAADLTAPGSTSCQASDPDTSYIAIGGTSASTPVFAGIMALVNQATGSRQGNAANVLYKLAGQTGNSCNSSNGAGTNCVFYDTTNGTIAMPCANGSPNCTISTPGDTVGVLAGYATATGYDLATGLGSVNANNLVTKWKNVALTKSSTTLSLNSGAAISITHGQSVNVAISVSGTGGPPTGNVALIANTGPNGTEGVQGFTLSAGAASGTTNSLPGGSNYTVVANYAGDGTFGSSASSPPITVNVAPEASSTSSAFELFNPTNGQQTNANASTAQYGSLELLRMNVTSQAGDACAASAALPLGCPTGSLTVTNNNAALDGGTFQLNSQGYAEDQSVQLPGGTNTVKLSYPGDSSYNASSQTSVITITTDPTQTIATTAPNGVLGNPTVVGATVDGSGLGAAPGGTVQFFSGSTKLGAAVPVSGVGGSFTNSPNALASTSTTQLVLGNNNITAQYSGDGNYAASTSVASVIDVQIPTQVNLTSSNPTIQHGSSVTFTATILPAQAGGPGPTGTVSFSGSAGSLGVIPVTNGQAQVTTSSLPGGSFEIVATYSGDVNYVSNVGFVPETVNLLNTTTTIMSSNSSIQQGTSVTLTSSVTATQAGGPALTGTVQFYYDFSAVGGDSINLGSAVALASGQAQLTTSALPANIMSVGAIYSGDSNYNGSAVQIAQTVSPAPTFTVSASPTTVPITSPGQSGSTTLTFTSENGFTSNGAVTLTPVCTGLPFEARCSSGSSITIPANGTATATVTFFTTAPSAVAPSSRYTPGSYNKWTSLKVTALASLLCIVMFLMASRKKLRLRSAVLTLIACGLLIAASACGGGGGGGGGGVTNPGTPAGVYNNVSVGVTINGVTANVPLTINLQ